MLYACNVMLNHTYPELRESTRRKVGRSQQWFTNLHTNLLTDTDEDTDTLQHCVWKSYTQSDSLLLVNVMLLFLRSEPT